MFILAIETSCDETAIALIKASGALSKPRFEIISNLVSSQINIHRPFGGVVPMLAKRAHAENLPQLYQKTLKNAGAKNLDFIDLIAATIGPGLEPALWEGINFAKYLASKFKKPIIGVNHLEGHLYSFSLNQKKPNPKFSARGLPRRVKAGRSTFGRQISNSKAIFPAIALIVSGGHTIILLVTAIDKWKKLGETRDDAAGESFDKVARLIGLQYPGGPEIEKLAKLGSSAKINFPRPMINSKNFDFSFSGLKTAVLYFWQNFNQNTSLRTLNAPIEAGKNGLKITKADIAASFQEAVTDVLAHKAKNAIEKFKAKSLLLSGGVAANKYLRKRFASLAKNKKIEFFAPSAEFNTDNAAMISIAAYINYLSKRYRKMMAQGNLSI